MATDPGAAGERAGPSPAGILKLVPRPRFLFLFVSYRGPGTSSRVSFSFIGLPYLVLVYKDSTFPQQRTAQDWDPGTAGGKVRKKSS